MLDAADDVYTVVDGKRVDMTPGDVVLTPSWCWHGHANDGSETAFWLISSMYRSCGMLRRCSSSIILRSSNGRRSETPPFAFRSQLFSPAEQECTAWIRQGVL